MKRKNWIFLLSVVTFLLSFSASGRNDEPGSSDHPSISRYPNTYISFYLEKEYDSFLVATGKMADGEVLPPVSSYEGKTTTIEYYSNDNKSSLFQVFKNYENAFKKLNLKQIFSCESDNGCGNRFLYQLYWYGNKKRQSMYRMLDAPNSPGSEYRFWAGQGKIGGQQHYITLVVEKTAGWPTVVMLDINQVRDLEDNLIAIDMDGLISSISDSGKVVLDGLLFDTNKSKLKPESESVIKTVASYLKKHPSKRFFVVGHTDSDGGYQFNLDLSKSRANTVVERLVSAYGVQRSRFMALGVGPISPIAKNSTGANKKRNRRVELVEM